LKCGQNKHPKIIGKRIAGNGSAHCGGTQEIFAPDRNAWGRRRIAGIKHLSLSGRPFPNKPKAWRMSLLGASLIPLGAKVVVIYYTLQSSNFAKRTQMMQRSALSFIISGCY